MKKFAIAGVLLLASSICSATTVTFGEIPLLNGDSPTMEYGAFGITLENVYYYEDNRDTFDGKGISVRINPGRVLFNNPTNLSIDYWVIDGFRGMYAVFDSNDALLESIEIDGSNGDVLGAHTFASGNIASLEFSPIVGFIQVSTLRFGEVNAIPEPATMGLLGLGLLGLGIANRRNRGG